MVQKKVLNKKNLYNLFLGFLTKKGKKTSAKFILETGLSLSCKQLSMDSPNLFLTIFKKLNTFVEVKKIKIKKRVHLVPFPLSIKRRIYLVIKWLLFATKINKNKVSTSIKLANELIGLLTTTSSTSLSMKLSNNKNAVLSRSNSHFRW